MLRSRRDQVVARHDAQFPPEEVGDVAECVGHGGVIGCAVLCNHQGIKGMKKAERYNIWQHQKSRVHQLHIICV
jgi:hypothetical protein